ncbi:MAG: LysM peptidoglycan-binding domain-containing protein, partial [Chloroflexota bacterium]|nr:LysM peptidoglycan-binding domain-containing protein [Chloroflexota bacterium]
MRRVLVGGLLVLAVGTAAVGGQPLVANLESTATNRTEHVVEAGDSLSGIAERYGVTIGQLAALNELENPDALIVGQVVRLPADVSARLATAGSSGGADAARSAPAEARAAGEYVV